MSSFVIEGGYKLSGAIRPQGAKNEALEVISATLLTDEEVTISNIPEILDVRNLIILLEGIGVKVTRLEKGKYTFKADSVDTEYVASDDSIHLILSRIIKNNNPNVNKDEKGNFINARFPPFTDI